MPLSYDKQQRAFVDAVATLVHDDEQLNPSRGDASAELWRKMVELELPAMLVPIEHDGLGLTPVEMVAVVEAAGRSLTATPLAMTTGAFTPAVTGAAGTSKRAREVVARLLRGMTGTLAVTPACPNAIPGAVVSAGHLTVPTTIIPDAEADLVALPALNAESCRHVLVLATPQELGVRVSAGIGRAQRLGTLELARHPISEEWLIEHDPRTAVATALIAAAAELVGLAERLVAMSVEHARARTQFNQPIGHFQAVKHRLADTHIAVERARSLTIYAAIAATESRKDLAPAAHRAKAAASESATAAARAAVQVHGASGITTANPISALYLRAREKSMLLGGPDQHYSCACLTATD